MHLQVHHGANINQWNGDDGTTALTWAGRQPHFPSSISLSSALFPSSVSLPASTNTKALFPSVSVCLYLPISTFPSLPLLSTLSAVRNNNAQSVAWMTSLEGLDVDHQEKTGDTALIVACEWLKGKPGTVLLLLHYYCFCRLPVSTTVCLSQLLSQLLFAL